MTPWGWGESSVFSVLRDSTSLRLQNFAVKFQKVLGGESIDRACLSTRHALPDGVRTEDKWMPRVRRPASGACRAVRPAAAELACGPRLLWGMMPRSPRGDDMGSPTGVRAQRRKVAKGLHRGGLAGQRRSDVAHRLPPAACRRPPPPAARLLP